MINTSNAQTQLILVQKCVQSRTQTHILTFKEELQYKPAVTFRIYEE